MVSAARQSAPPKRTATKASIVADFRASMGELKCIGSERLVRQGVSMTQLHILHMLEHHGEMPMNRLADMLDVSVSNATGLIDRVEERGFVERIRVASDRRVVVVQLTPSGRQMLDEIEDLREEVLRRVLDQLSATQLDGVATAMADLRMAVAATATDPESGAHHHHANVSQGRD
jgi:DNA-binding MarR family transcriptional regulator